MEEEVAPVSILCVKEEDVGKRAEVDEEGVEDPEEGEESPVGMVVIEEVEDESLNIGGDVDDWKNDVEENKLDKCDLTLKCQVRNLFIDLMENDLVDMKWV